jgi:putative transposase
MSDTLTKLLVHCVFSTKDRRPFLSDPISDRLNAYMAGVAANHDMHLLRAGGMPDHRHILVQVKPTMCISDAVGILKANTSRWVKHEFSGMEAFTWQTGYGAFSISQSSAARVIEYIEGQARHHAKSTFQKEFLKLLDAHEIEYDKAHVFD